MDSNFTDNYLQEIENDPEYSLQVDPLNKYGMSDEQKAFIDYYIQFKNIPYAAKMAGIDLEMGETYFVSYASQQEIRRINKSLVQRQFVSKMMTIDEIGGYLTSLITDENVPLGDRLRTKDKLKVVDLLIQLHDSKYKAIDNPRELSFKDLDMQVKELSIETIKQLLNADNSKDKKEVIKELKKDSQLSPEEITYLETLSTKDLLDLIDQSNKEK